jgi:RNA polymerase sigma-70 factor (ECF subfamily)
VVALNRAVAIRFARGASAGLLELELLEEEPLLAGYHYFAAARGDCLRELGRIAEAREAYAEALSRTNNSAERAFITKQMQQISP